MDEQPKPAVQVTQHKLKNLQTKIVEAPVPSLYVNHAQFSMSEWDIRIDLSEQHVIDQDPNNAETAIMSIVPKLRLIMTPTYAQLFSRILHEVLEKRLEATKQAQSEKAKAAENIES